MSLRISNFLKMRLTQNPRFQLLYPYYYTIVWCCNQERHSKNIGKVQGIPATCGFWGKENK